MQYWGKILGVLLGIVSGGGFWAILLGLIVGHMIDNARNVRRGGFFANQQARQALFFRTTFQVMGHLTKSKGRVTEVDIKNASIIMNRMQLFGSRREDAQQAFREGKQSSYPLRAKLKEFRTVCFGRADLLRMFLEIQLQAAFADGVLHPNERQVLHVIAEELGISRVQLDRLLDMIQSGRQFGGGWQGQQGGYSAHSGPTLEDACSVLGVKPEDDAATIKRAYRKLMTEHHPDKLVAKGLPPEMMEIAKQKAQEIQAAYDLIKREKGFK
ncbi:co-chaperone protein DjlA [Leminorella grimontii]|uniref:Co-chaperone protein DjlA n=1 Tax=Leminorella grimontii TaxID=82981 RepID=A0AAV5N3D9_9GAMM|nr:co-chaperone DjlA [Leminorella grimontii]KFC95157.1 DnaJ family protein [Leminorella grimontii ATCC 33999 = DSM 5078]GKX56244.1 co-chaperone protein DjlA [Leminorella grimontii]VFS60898.1 DnaJ-like protein DjlA [Leminorella grimontii]